MSRTPLSNVVTYQSSLTLVLKLSSVRLKLIECVLSFAAKTNITTLLNYVL